MSKYCKITDKILFCYKLDCLAMRKILFCITDTQCKITEKNFYKFYRIEFRFCFFNIVDPVAAARRRMLSFLLKIDLFNLQNFNVKKIQKNFHAPLSFFLALV